MTTQADYTAAVDQMVQGELPLGEADKILAVGMALKTHSRHKPLVLVEDATGDGGFDYELIGATPILASWSDGFSIIKEVEYPIDDTQPLPNILPDDEWTVRQLPDGPVLRFLEDKPVETEDMRVTYTALHAFGLVGVVETCTVKAMDEEAVQALAAAYVCDLLATYYAQNQDSTIAADSVDHKSKASEYSARSQMYRTFYYNHIGIEEGKTVAASVTMDRDVTPSWQADHLTHGRKYR
jgi:hypothetical protein